MNKNKRTLFIIGISLGAILLATGTYFAIKHFTSEEGTDTSEVKRVNYAESAEELRNDEVVTSDDTQRIYNKYYGQYEEVRDNILASDPTKWTDETVEQAAFLLVFTQRTESYNMTHLVLTALDRAEAAGVDVDKYGLTPEYRAEVSREATEGAGGFDRTQGDQSD